MYIGVIFQYSIWIWDSDLLMESYRCVVLNAKLDRFLRGYSCRLFSRYGSNSGKCVICERGFLMFERKFSSLVVRS